VIPRFEKRETWGTRLIAGSISFLIPRFEKRETWGTRHPFPANPPYAKFGILTLRPPAEYPIAILGEYRAFLPQRSLTLVYNNIQISRGIFASKFA
jgi:hypothetical protein